MSLTDGQEDLVRHGENTNPKLQVDKALAESMKWYEDRSHGTTWREWSKWPADQLAELEGEIQQRIEQANTKVPGRISQGFRALLGHLSRGEHPGGIRHTGYPEEKELHELKQLLEHVQTFKRDSEERFAGDQKHAEMLAQRTRDADMERSEMGRSYTETVLARRREDMSPVGSISFAEELAHLETLRAERPTLFASRVQNHGHALFNDSLALRSHNSRFRTSRKLRTADEPSYERMRFGKREVSTEPFLAFSTPSFEERTRLLREWADELDRLAESDSPNAVFYNTSGIHQTLELADEAIQTMRDDFDPQMDVA